jgi:hypothetical protein
MFNEPFVEYDNGDYKAQIATFVHEVLHALYFHPGLFEIFPQTSAGLSFMFEDNGVYKLRGDTILKSIQSHYNCSTANGGKRSHFCLITSSFGKQWRKWISRCTF